MIDALLNHIRLYIIGKNPLTFLKSFSGARQYINGKVIIYNSADNVDNYEGDYVGLSDSFGNYFYIRYLDEVETDLVSEDQRTVACNEQGGFASLRLVAWVKNGDIGRLQEVLLTDLKQVDFNTLSSTDKQRFSDIKQPITGNIMTDFEQIYIEEVEPEEDNEIKLVDNVTLTAIDFTLNFNYRAIEACINRNICV